MKEAVFHWDFQAAEEWRARSLLRQRQRGGAPVSSPEYWNRFTLWDEYERYLYYPGELLRLVSRFVDRETTVLDVGAGSGALAIPLSRTARAVTALEPSGAQLKRFKSRLEQEPRSNIRFVRQIWQEADLPALGRHDLVLASYSLFMPEIVEALRKIFALAAIWAVLIHLHNHDLQTLLAELPGSPAPAPDGQLLARVLKEMGVAAETRTVRRTFTLPLALQLDLFRYNSGMSERQAAVIKTRLKTRTASISGTAGTGSRGSTRIK